MTEREQLIAGVQLALAHGPHSSLLNMKAFTVVHQYQTKSVTMPSPQPWLSTDKNKNIVQTQRLPWKEPHREAHMVRNWGPVPRDSTHYPPVWDIVEASSPTSTNFSNCSPASKWTVKPWDPKPGPSVHLFLNSYPTETVWERVISNRSLVTLI